MTRRDASAPDRGDRERRARGGRDALWASAALLATTVAVGTPAGIYGASRDDFNFGFVQIGLLLLVACGLLFALVAGPAFLLPKKWRALWSQLAFAGATLVWFSSTVLVFDFGLLDGELLAIGDKARWIWPEIGLMLVWLVVAVLACRRYGSTCRSLAWLLFLAVAATTLIELVRDLPKWQSARPESSRELFSFHARENVLVVLLDTFQADIFEQTLDEHPDLSAALDGFVFFRDTLGLAPTTAMTMPGVHTGLEYEKDWSVRHYFREAKKEEGFLEAVAQAGHQVSVVNAFGFCPKSGALCRQPGLVMDSPVANLVAEALQLVDLAIFRAVPLAMKQKVYGRGAWLFTRLLDLSRPGGRIRMSVELLDRLAQEAEVSAARPTMKFVHLPTPHPPLVTLADCSFSARQLDRSRRAMLDQSRCALAAFARILDRLRELEIYDGSTLVLMADHGARMSSRYAERVAEDRRWRAVVGGANPLLAIKPAGRRGAVEISNRPARISDVGATVCAAVEGCSYPRGMALFADAMPADRPRRYLYYRKWRNEFWTAETSFPATLYEVTGPLSDRSSWRAVAKVGAGS